VTTVEGLPDTAKSGPLAQCFIDHGGAQCGICTPGILVSAEALLQRRPDPTDAEIREAIAGNLCRCTGYQRIVDSVTEAAKQRRANGGAA
jgi:carbon-monoxide dehydrogenase small subunit